MTRALILTATLLVCTAILTEAIGADKPAPGPRAPAAAVLPAAPVAGATPKGVVVDRCLITVLEQVSIPAKEAGVLETLLVREGTLIVVGQEIGTLDSEKAGLEKKQAEYEHQVAEKTAASKVDIHYAEASWRVAKSHLERGEEANAKVPNSVAVSEMAERQLNVEKAFLQIEKAKVEHDVAQVTAQAKKGLIDLAHSNLKRRTVLAPTSGMVVEMHKKSGEWLNPGDPIVRVMRVDRLRVEGFLDADKHGRELTGRPVVVEAAMSGGKREKFAGKVVFISPEVEPVTNHFRIFAEVENPNLDLRPGTRASMEIAKPEKEMLAKEAPAKEALLPVKAPLVKEPLVKEPLVKEPLVKEPLTKEPLVKEPLTKEPLTKEPLVKEPLVKDPPVKEAPKEVPVKGPVGKEPPK